MVQFLFSDCVISFPPPPVFCATSRNHYLYLPLEAVCTGLGLLAHLDGSHVRFLGFSSRHDRSEQSDGTSVADIDLEAGWRTQNPDDKREKAASSLRREGGGGPPPATTFQGPARGLSWGRCRFPAGSASMESGDSLADLASRGGTGRGVGVGAVEGVRRDQCGEIACHIAVAYGPEVLLWKVSRVRCDSIGGSTEEGEVTNKQEIRYRYSTVSVRTDWHRGSRGVDSDGSTEREKTAMPNGNIRCLSFRPCGGGSVGSSAAAGVVGGDDNVPLTAWYDAGAAVLG